MIKSLKNSSIKTDSSSTSMLVGNDYYIPLITNGLYLYYDAGNPASYPGTGSALYDLSGNSRTSSLVGASYSSSNGGVINFSSGNYISVPPISRVPTATIEIWFNTDTLSDLGYVREYIYTQQTDPPNMASYTYQNRQGITIAGRQISGQFLNTGGGDNGFTCTTTLATNTWYQFVATTSANQAKCYLNGQLVNTVNYSTGYPNASFTPNEAYIGRRADPQGEDWYSGKIAILMDYNRELSASEVLTNFNYYRSRFGL